MVTIGMVNVSRTDGLAISVVGGSGRFRSATGHTTQGAPQKGFDSVDILHLD